MGENYDEPSEGEERSAGERAAGGGGDDGDDGDGGSSPSDGDDGAAVGNESGSEDSSEEYRKKAEELQRSYALHKQRKAKKNKRKKNKAKVPTHRKHERKRPKNIRKCVDKKGEITYKNFTIRQYQARALSPRTNIFSIQRRLPRRVPGSMIRTT